jgi:hypothetical protein
LRLAREVLPRLSDDYKRTYYAGLICERRAKVHLHRNTPGSGALAYEWLREAMDWYDRAESIRPPQNDESILRWNACARLLDRRAHLSPAPDDAPEPGLE